MASLRDEARPYLDDFRNAINWIAVWKVGRGWNVQLIWSAEYQEGCKRWNREEKWMIDVDEFRRWMERQGPAAARPALSPWDNVDELARRRRASVRGVI